jgi:signal transduction histidine kinase
VLVLATVPIVVGLFGTTFARVAVAVALDGQELAIIDGVTQATRVAVGLTVACAAMASFGAALLLRGSIRAGVEELQAATAAIAAGEFDHRVARSDRRDELGHLADAIDAMASRLQHLEQARRRLLACVSHELRTPLTIVRGHAFTLARSEAEPARRSRFGLIEAEAARLAGLMDDLVDAASLHAGGVRLRRERCDLLGLVEAACGRFQAAAAEAEVGIRISAEGRRHDVDVDPLRLDQVLANLLANAVRHAPGGTTIEVRVVHGAGDRRIVEVSNRASEIPASLAERLFEPFVQHGEQSGRVGLGMGIARDLIEAHGGALLLVARGCEGWFTLRFDLPAPGRLPPLDSVPPSVGLTGRRA